MLTLGRRVFAAGLSRMRGRSRRDVLSLAAGTAGAQLLAVAFSPIITRFYGPEAFGAFGAYAAVLMVMGPVSALAYPLGIVLPKHDDEALGLVRLSVLLSLLVASGLAIALVVIRGSALAGWRLDEIGNLRYFLPLGVLAGAWMQIAQHWLTRQRAFTVLARRSVVTSLITHIAKVLMGLVWPTALSLVIVSLIGQVAGVFCLLVGVGRGDPPSSSTPVVGQRFTLGEIARRYRELPLFRAPQMCINAASQGLPVLMLATFGNPAAAGLYTLAKSVLAMPATLLGQSVQQVFFPRCNEAAIAKQPIAPLIKRATVELGGIALGPFLVLGIGAPFIFGVAFGPEWSRAGQYAQWMSPWLFCALVNRPSVAAITVLRMQGLFLTYEIVSVILRAAAIGYGFKVMHSDLGAVALFSLVGVVLNVALVTITILAARRHDSNLHQLTDSVVEPPSRL